MKKNLWNFEGNQLKTEEYPHVILREYAQGLENQTNGEIKVLITNKISYNGFETYFSIKLKNLPEITLFKVISDKIRIYPVTILLDSNSYTKMFDCVDSKDFEEKMDDLIKDTKVGAILSYYLQLNEINDK